MPLSFGLLICREADESRLREVCESFLGPPMGMVGSASSTDPQNPGWDPEILVSFLSRAICTLDWSTFVLNPFLYTAKTVQLQ
jgi:hypothetical protein